MREHRAAPGASGGHQGKMGEIEIESLCGFWLWLRARTGAGDRGHARTAQRCSVLVVVRRYSANSHTHQPISPSTARGSAQPPTRAVISLPPTWPSLDPLLQIHVQCTLLHCASYSTPTPTLVCAPFDIHITYHTHRRASIGLRLQCALSRTTRDHPAGSKNTPSSSRPPRHSGHFVKTVKRRPLV
ncbi:hypothetical protein GY45DRAFT_584013 [Cubamyces sp. BRFM 1775]|nr:hypothetical protein GY45DRAFT_584013 [Cubamyces sp. BRFM 1775]